MNGASFVAVEGEKTVLTNLLTCALMVNASSMITPRLRTFDEGVIHTPEMSSGDIGQFQSCPVDPSQIISIFDGFRSNRFDAIQLFTASTKSEKRATSVDADVECT